MINFNYIITIHNKEKILERTLKGVESCSSKNSIIYPVLDGCTDRSEKIVQEFIKRTNRRIIIIKTPDVHELKSINVALRRIRNGFTICLQDDVILQDPDLEKKVENLYKKIPSLGNVSFCRAVNLRRMSPLRQLRHSGLHPLFEECDLVKVVHDSCPNGKEVEYEEFVYRMVAVKSPICFPESAIKKVGIFDENLAPFAYDDHEYCLRLLKAGFKNGLFPLRFISKLEWGGTRKDKSFSRNLYRLQIQHNKYIWEKHGRFIEELSKIKTYN